MQNPLEVSSECFSEQSVVDGKVTMSHALKMVAVLE